MDFLSELLRQTYLEAAQEHHCHQGTSQLSSDANDPCSRAAQLAAVLLDQNRDADVDLGVEAIKGKLQEACGFLGLDLKLCPARLACYESVRGSCRAEMHGMP